MTRAREPEADGYVERDGVKLSYEVHGTGEPTIVLLPTWSIIHSRHWKMQVPHLARTHRVVTFDGRGNGRSDRPAGAAVYTPWEFAADTTAVLDHLGIDDAVLVSLSLGALWALLVAVDQPERVSGAVFIGPSTRFGPAHVERAVYSFDDVLDSDEGWAKYNRHYWQRDYRGFIAFFFSQIVSEPHSTKQREDCVGWDLGTTPETLIATVEAMRDAGDPDTLPEVLRGSVGACSARCSSSTATTTGSRPTRGARRSRRTRRGRSSPSKDRGTRRTPATRCA